MRKKQEMESVTFIEGGCMGNFLMITKIKKIKTIKYFDSFYSLIYLDDVHTYNKCQFFTDKYFWKLSLC